jgi:hypothetical protein
MVNQINDANIGGLVGLRLTREKFPSFAVAEIIN